MSKARILYITHIPATFIDKDTHFLKERYELSHYKFHKKKDYEILFHFVKQLFFLAIYIRRSDAILTQFAGYHTLLPAIFAKVFNKPLIVIACGTDCFSFPSISYGNFRKKALGFCTKITYQLADHIAPVDDSLILSKWPYYPIDSPVQGILHFCPKVKAKFRTIFNGYDTSIFQTENVAKRPRSFITIGKNTETKPVFLRKGIDLILGIAPQFPDCTFTIIGMNDKDLMPVAPPNVFYFEFLPQKELSKLLNESQFYLQLSIAEGFPNALCEAMLCECVPIGSNVAGIPKIIENTGFLLQKKDSLLLERLVKEALLADLRLLGQKAKERIITEFPLERRKQEFYSLIDQVVTKKGAGHL